MPRKRRGLRHENNLLENRRIEGMVKAGSEGSNLTALTVMVHVLDVKELAGGNKPQP